MTLRRAALLVVTCSLASCAFLQPAQAPPPIDVPAAEPPQATASQPVAPSPQPPDPDRYRCDGGPVVRMAVTRDGLQVDGIEGVQQLLRDAGGVGPQQSVWSNERLRVELGLGDAADEASVQLLGSGAATWRCRRG